MSLVKFKNPYLKKIINVYQPKYKNLTAQGFGDYLRGCFCIFQICKMYSIEFDMDLSNHPMCNFLDLNNKDIYIGIDRNNISWFSDPNYIPIDSKIFIKDSINFHNKFVSHLNTIKEENYYLFCNSFPVFNIINDNSRNFILNKIVPKSEIKTNVINSLTSLGLNKKQFSVIHIRCGDDYLLNNHSLKVNYVKKILKNLQPFLKVNRKYLILSDNNNIKYFFRNYKNCVFYVRSITHLGENGDKEENKIKNTLLDFYIMSESNYIISVSPYTWGSGFSQWCSVIYKIPYKKIII